MKNNILNYFTDVKNIIKNKRFLNYFILYSSIFVISIIISTIIGLGHINISDTVIYYVKNYTSLKYADNISMIHIIANNFFISILLMYFFFLKGKFKNYFGIFYFISYGIITGMALSIVALKYNMIIALSMILPHGIIEIPTIITAIASGFIIEDMNDKKDKISNEKIKVLRTFISMSIFMFIMLFIAGYIEANITPYIAKSLILYYKL